MYEDIITCLLTFILAYVAYQVFCKVERYYKVDDPVLSEIKDQLSVLHPKFKNLELYEGDKSYTINKKKVYICLKDKNGRYYPC